MRASVFGLLVLGILLLTLSVQPAAAQSTNDNTTPVLSASAAGPAGFPSPATDPGDNLGARTVPGTLPVPVAALAPMPVLPATLVQPVAMPRPLHKTEWKLSLLALVAAHSADAATSWQKRELNPLLSPGSGAFGWQSLAIKGGIAVGSLTVQAFTLHHHPEAAKRFAIMNYIEAGAIGGVAAHNATIPR